MFKSWNFRPPYLSFVRLDSFQFKVPQLEFCAHLETVARARLQVLQDDALVKGRVLHGHFWLDIGQVSLVLENTSPFKRIRRLPLEGDGRGGLVALFDQGRGGDAWREGDVFGGGGDGGRGLVRVDLVRAGDAVDGDDLKGGWCKVGTTNRVWATLKSA